MKNNPSSDDLSVFLTVVQERGFRAAARLIGIAPSKVSATVSRLEAQLGVPLLRRTTRSVCLTEAGQRLSDRIAPLFVDLQTACIDTANLGARVQGHLRLNVPGAVMPDILPRLMATYQRRYPDVEVEIIVESGLVDIVASGCDAGIRYGDIIEKDMISIPIGPRIQQIALGASPGYIEAKGMPRNTEDLLSHDAIRYRLPSGPLLPWVLDDGSRTLRIEPNTRLVLSVSALNTGLCFAQEGIGIIGAFRNWLDADLSAGRLVPVLEDWWPSSNGPRLYYPSRSTPSPLRAFIEVCRTYP